MLFCVFSAVTPEEEPVTMPQANKSVSGAGVPGQVSAPDRGEPPPPPVVPDARSQEAAGDCQPAAGVAELEQGDPQIIKSPSDPKKYRWGRSSSLLLLSKFDSGPRGGAWSSVSLKLQTAVWRL